MSFLKGFAAALLVFVAFQPVWADSVPGVVAVPLVQQQDLVTPDAFRATLDEGFQKELDLSGLLALQAAEKVVILDVRGKESFDAWHIKGALNVPLTELTGETLAAAVPDKEAHVVLACDYSFMPVRMMSMTMQAYPVARQQGYKNIYRLNLWMSEDGSISLKDVEKQLPFEGVARPVWFDHE